MAFVLKCFGHRGNNSVSGPPGERARPMVVKSIQVRPVDYETDLRVSGSRLSLFQSTRGGSSGPSGGQSRQKVPQKSQRGVLTCPITPPIMVATGHAPDRFSLETNKKRADRVDSIGRFIGSLVIFAIVNQWTGNFDLWTAVVLFAVV